MKALNRIFTGVVTALFLFFLMSGDVVAQTKKGSDKQTASEVKKKQNANGETVQTQELQNNSIGRDHDGDGIPNGKDPDYEPMGSGKGKGTKGFIDEDGDGFNDRAQDHDGDGIPNGQDPDYEPMGSGKGKGAKGFIDENGDGLNDWAQDADGDGIPNGQDPDYEKPQDGSGRKLGNGGWNEDGQGGGSGNKGAGSGKGNRGKGSGKGKK